MSDSHRFKIGDVVEGEEDGVWVIGEVVTILRKELGVKVYQSKRLKDYAVNIEFHDLAGALSTNNGWFVMAKNAVLSKNYIISKILEEL